MLQPSARRFKRTRFSNHDTMFFCPCQSRVEKLGIEHYMVRKTHNHYNTLVLHPLNFMNTQCVGEVEIVTDVIVFVVYDELFIRIIDITDLILFIKPKNKSAHTVKYPPLARL